jgi:hypothetical protein
MRTFEKEMRQSELSGSAFKVLFTAVTFDTIIELGTGCGAFTMLLKSIQDDLLNDVDYYTYDIISGYDLGLNLTEMGVLGITFAQQDIFAEGFATTLSGLKSGKNLWICDNGNKLNEFALVAPLMSVDDYVVIHDYFYDDADRDSINNEFGWPFTAEATWAQISATCATNAISESSTYKALFRPACWFIGVKGS